MTPDKIEKQTCEQYYIVLPGQSWNTFTISPVGDFFIHGDWGYWAFNWRSFGDNFKSFLATINTQYLIDKLESNELAFGKRKGKIPARVKEAITAHFEAFQGVLMEELKTQPKAN